MKTPELTPFDTVQNLPIKNLHWNLGPGIKGYFGLVWLGDSWKCFMWDKNGQTGNPDFNIGNFTF